MDADESCTLTISGGTLTIDADGDGIDTNGYFYMTGGTVFIAGPENNGNSALDYGISAVISGGYFLASGFSGMAQKFQLCFYTMCMHSNSANSGRQFCFHHQANRQQWDYTAYAHNCKIV